MPNNRRRTLRKNNRRRTLRKNNRRRTLKKSKQRNFRKKSRRKTGKMRKRYVGGSTWWDAGINLLGLGSPAANVMLLEPLLALEPMEQALEPEPLLEPEPALEPEPWESLSLDQLKTNLQIWDAELERAKVQLTKLGKGGGPGYGMAVRNVQDAEAGRRRLARFVRLKKETMGTPHRTGMALRSDASNPDTPDSE